MFIQILGNERETREDGTEKRTRGGTEKRTTFGTDKQTDRQTDGQTDKGSYRSGAHLKR